MRTLVAWSVAERRWEVVATVRTRKQAYAAARAFGRERRLLFCAFDVVVTRTLDEVADVVAGHAPPSRRGRDVMFA